MKERIKPQDLIKTTTPIEHKQNIMKGLVSQIPVIGSILTEYLPNLRLEKIKRFAIQISEDLEELKEEIDKDY